MLLQIVVRPSSALCSLPRRRCAVFGSRKTSRQTGGPQPLPRGGPQHVVAFRPPSSARENRFFGYRFRMTFTSNVSTFGRPSRRHPRMRRPAPLRVGFFDKRLCSPYPVLAVSPPGICAVRWLRLSVVRRGEDAPSAARFFIFHSGAAVFSGKIRIFARP